MHLTLADQDVTGAGAAGIGYVEQGDGGVLFPESLQVLGGGEGLAQGTLHAVGGDLEVGDVLEVGAGEGAELLAEEVGTGGRVTGGSLWGLLAGPLVGCGARPVGDVACKGRSLVEL